jgi:hypothetical protein
VLQGLGAPDACACRPRKHEQLPAQVATLGVVGSSKLSSCNQGTGRAASLVTDDSDDNSHHHVIAPHMIAGLSAMLLCCTGSTTTHSRVTRSGRTGGRTILHLGGHILVPVRPATQPCQSSSARSAARRWQPARCGHSQRRETLSLSQYSCCGVVRLDAGLQAVAFCPVPLTCVSGTACLRCRILCTAGHRGRHRQQRTGAFRVPSWDTVQQ